MENNIADTISTFILNLKSLIGPLISLLTTVLNTLKLIAVFHNLISFPFVIILINILINSIQKRQIVFSITISIILPKHKLFSIIIINITYIINMLLIQFKTVKILAITSSVLKHFKL
jgi:hypothetical protein